jgi:polyisoprenoid-binding protein YceI
MTSAALLALLLTAPAGTAYVVDASASTLQYHVVHKLHRVDAVSRKIEGKVVVQADGKVLAMFRTPIASFDSGDGNRDSHMQEVMEVGTYPFAVVKAVSRVESALRPATTAPVTTKVEVRGEVELHGVSTPVILPVTLELRSDGTIRARGTFEVSLDAHRIERPSLLFVKLDDACRIDLDLVLREVKQ